MRSMNGGSAAGTDDVMTSGTADDELEATVGAGADSPQPASNAAVTTRIAAGTVWRRFAIN
ncbi:hypothetical protein GCM10007298_17490 [Williamsia phyllosphaerae]|uniref:Uncharacterized protein n=1 Tax=Williamsia phyllosphaerae TaxID=885042 RepID=A0ABQ1UPM6_9NOCA|nr:hypothetical protein GCM10007298_17490 [Williamsia phyllosphaerae]